ncbi:MAG: BatD family protein [Gemmatimonadaceae bacterium]
MTPTLRAFALLSVLVVAIPISGRAQRGKSPRDSVGQAAGLGVSIVDAASLTGREDIAVRSHVIPSRVYVGQQTTYEVGVFLSDETRARMRRNPEFIPPEMRSMLSYDLATPTTVPARVVDGRRYEVHIFRRALFPLAAGTLQIPPARLNYALPLSNSFFSREETHTERTQQSSIQVIEPPMAGRPRAYRGAVGQLALEASIDNRQGRLGDPLLLTVAVSGVGNVSMVPRPELTVAWGDAVPGAERIRVDTTGTIVRGRKEFEYLVTPRRSGALTVPMIEYAYFDPYVEEYRTAVSSPIEVLVAPGSALLATRLPADSEPLLPIRREFRGEIPRPIPSSTWYWLVIALTPLPALLLAAYRRPRQRRVVTPATRIRSMVARGTADPSALRRDYVLAIADRIPGSAATLSNHSRLARTLRRAGVSPDVAADAARLLAEMDASVFGHAPVGSNDLAERADRALRAVDDEALPREEIRRVPHRATIATVVVFALVGASVAVVAAEPTTEFGAAVSAYDARDLPRARAMFESVALQYPRAADAWANAGSVAWQMGDTADAAFGWHRALRLEPLAEDVRDYLEYTPGFRGGPFGDVPAIPLSAVAILGALLWIAGCAVMARGATTFVRQRVGGGLALAAFVTALAGVSLSDVFHGRHAAIVKTAERLRASPALTAEQGAEVLPGELARESGEQTAWTRVRLRDGRRGWIESRHLLSLETRD